MQAIILAGGFGTRLRSVVGDVPKPMAPVAGRPFLACLLESLSEQGFKRVVLSVYYQAKHIRACFGDWFAGMQIDYAEEPEPLGTGGAIAFALQKVDQDKPVFVLNGDTFVSLNYRDWETDAVFSVALCQVPDTARYGRVELINGTVTAFHEKGMPGRGLINAGVYRIQPDLLRRFDLPMVFSFEQDFLYPRVAELKPEGRVTDGYFIDIGVPEDYARAQVELPRVTSQAPTTA